jgi:hypothetical protein
MKLKKTVTEDGIFSMAEHIEVGNTYVLDIDRQGPMRWANKDYSGKEFLRPSVYAYSNDGKDGGWLPKELFGI